MTSGLVNFRSAARAPAALSLLLSLPTLSFACGDTSDPWREPKPTDTEQSNSSAQSSPGGSAPSSSEPTASSGGGAASDSDAGASSGSQDASAQASGPAPTTPAQPLPPPTPTEYEMAKALVGNYAAVIKYRDVITVGIAGTGSLVTTVLGAAEIKDDPGTKSVRLGMSLCEARVGAQTKHLLDLDISVPKAALTGATMAPVALRATRDGAKVTWKADELRGVAGWKSASATDALPKRDDDPKLLDQDSDGKPGVTATFGGHAMGTIYLALDYRFVLAGSVEANGDLSGTTVSTSREGFLGSSELLLVGSTIERMADPEVADNTVRMVKKNGALSCDDVIAARDALLR